MAGPSSGCTEDSELRIQIIFEQVPSVDLLHAVYTPEPSNPDAETLQSLSSESGADFFCPHPESRIFCLPAPRAWILG